ncbi:MAG: YgiQ family radical SAM protein [Firmicutes bacterium]|nr:YgiQ family radical SAM protein [Bacillota bacterium]
MYLPISKKDLSERGISQLDFIMISGDAYVDHPSFGHALIARFIESMGFSVGIIPQPLSDKDFCALGVPNHAFLIATGVVDSMVGNYTVAKRKRDTDDYSPVSTPFLRPDRALTVYAKTLKRLFPDSFIIAGGVEGSLRRFAHYDYWDDSVLESCLISAPIDLLVYGMGEKPMGAILNAVSKGIPVHKIKDIFGTAYSSDYPSLSKSMREAIDNKGDEKRVILPSFSEVKASKERYLKAFNIQNAVLNKTLIQKHGERFVVVNPPAPPLTTKEIDAVYALPYEKNYHPIYEKLGGVKAVEEVRFSITSHRGCFGNCAFCSLCYHQGRQVQARSKESIISEAEEITKLNGFKGYIHDIGGPSANFYAGTGCESEKCGTGCLGKKCVGFKQCKNLKVSHQEYFSILREVAKIEGIKKVFIRSGIRFDYLLAEENPQYLNELIMNNISGQLKVAPEHVDNEVLKLMNKPPHAVYLDFYEKFNKINQKKNLKQYLVPYFISSHPGSTVKSAIRLAEYLKSINYTPLQVQDFYPTPSTASTAMYFTEMNPSDLKPVYVEKNPERKAMQRALLQFSKENNYRLVLNALTESGRGDLIGHGKNCLIKPK